jgi:hypothetical protein
MIRPLVRRNFDTYQISRCLTLRCIMLIALARSYEAKAAQLGKGLCIPVDHLRLFFVPQQFSLRVPDLQAVLVDYVMICAQGFGGFERRLEGLKALHCVATVCRDAKRSM